MTGFMTLGNLGRRSLRTERCPVPILYRSRLHSSSANPSRSVGSSDCASNTGAPFFAPGLAGCFAAACALDRGRIYRSRRRGVVTRTQPAVERERRHQDQYSGNGGLFLIFQAQLHYVVAPLRKYVSTLSCSRTLPCCSPSVTPSMTKNILSRSSALMNFTSCR